MNELIKNVKYTLRDYCKLIGETLEGLWTVRLTPAHMHQNIDTAKVGDELEDLIKTNTRVNKIICFEEGDDLGETARHYHIRMVTDYKTKKSVSDLMKRIFPIDDPDPLVPKKGNRALSVHDCKGKDRSVWHSATYIAKMGQLVYQYGYSDGKIAEIIKIGRQLMFKKGIPIYRQIIVIYKLDTYLELQPDDLMEIVQEYYKEFNKPMPEIFRLKSLMHSILFACNSTYAKNVRSKMCSHFRELCDPKYDPESFF